jgi:hypothetical protein
LFVFDFMISSFSVERPVTNHLIVAAAAHPTFARESPACRVQYPPGGTHP